MSVWCRPSRRMQEIQTFGLEAVERQFLGFVRQGLELSASAKDHRTTFGTERNRRAPDDLPGLHERQVRGSLIGTPALPVAGNAVI